MSVIKYMNRIVAGSGQILDKETEPSCPTGLSSDLQDPTYGITGDPLTQFACVFAALIHDVGHPGVPNPQFITENPELAEKYQNRSVAEQNSFDTAWNLFMEERFYELKMTICYNDAELQRFRELVILGVMATDLLDPDLKQLRNERWNRTFAKKDIDPEDESAILDTRNRKATIVIEHKMQHWEVYNEWNEKLFLEMHKAFVEGRAQRNPSDFWFEGELGFFDFYIVPLSEKLKECGVFGISSDENLNYAMENRKIWVSRGREIVDELRKKAEDAQSLMLAIEEEWD